MNINISGLLRAEINAFNRDISRIRQVLTDTTELFDEIDTATQISGGV